MGVHRDVVSGFGKRNRELAPIDLLGRVIAARPPTFPRKSLPDRAGGVALCVSMMAAVGLGSRPVPSRNVITR